MTHNAQQQILMMASDVYSLIILFFSKSIENEKMVTFSFEFSSGGDSILTGDGKVWKLWLAGVLTFNI